jgi:hypothetical protein
MEVQGDSRRGLRGFSLIELLVVIENFEGVVRDFDGEWGVTR